MVKLDLSFIVPVYNTPIQKLKRCIDSIEEITELVYEILIVDDGSNEEIGNTCRYICQKYSNCRYIYQNNQGVSSARNLGIEKSNSKYIFFVDSDDCIEAKAFTKEIKEWNYDLIYLDIMLMKKNRNELWNALERKGVVSQEDVLRKIVSDGKLNGPVGKIIRLDFLRERNIRFQKEMILGEDALFLLNMLKYNPRMYYLNINSYYYFWESTTGYSRLINHSKTIIDNYLQLVKEMKRVIETQAFETAVQNELLNMAIQRHIKQVFNLCAEMLENKMLSDENESELNRAISIIDRQILKECSKGYYFRAYLLQERKWRSIAIIAMIRRAYLKIKAVL